MIIKGGSRAGPSQLGRHLQRTDTNGRVEILELHSPLDSLTEALRDWQLLADGTRGHKGLYHANIDPDAKYQMTPEQWQRCVEVLEAELGMTGQPRAVVMHEKKGRQHIHVVWQRTDVETMTLRTDSNNYYAHERASLALEQEFGHEHVPGKHAKRDREKPPPKSEISHAEWQQGERSGIDPRKLKEAVTDLYERSDGGQAFRAALSNIGFALAKGDRRDYVIVGMNGDIYSLARQIKGVNAKELRAFMADVERESVPDIEQAKALQRDRAADKEQAQQQEKPKAPSPEELAKLDAALKARHTEETRQMQERQQSETKRTKDILNREINEKAEAFDAVQDAARDRWERKHNPQKRGMDALKDKVKAKLDPNEAVQQAWRKEQARDDYFKTLQADRAIWLAQQLAARDKDLQDLAERHAQQRREHAAKFQQERERYRQEQDAAKRLSEEFTQRAAERTRNRDGPERSGPTR
jgi:hypothetical protein